MTDINLPTTVAELQQVVEYLENKLYNVSEATKAKYFKVVSENNALKDELLVLKRIIDRQEDKIHMLEESQSIAKKMRILSPVLFLKSDSVGTGVHVPAPESIPLEIPDVDKMKWEYFRSEVSKIEQENTMGNYKFSLIHSSAGYNLYDIASETNSVKGEFFVNSKTLASAQLCKTLTKYAVTLIQGLFKPSIALFCTCYGSLKGKSADGQVRAALPKEPFTVFLDHCIGVGNKLFRENGTNVKSKVCRAINMHLQIQRQNKNFIPTKDQTVAYNVQMKRGVRPDQHD